MLRDAYGRLDEKMGAQSFGHEGEIEKKPSLLRKVARLPTDSNGFKNSPDIRKVLEFV